MELNLTSQQFVGVDSTESSYGETTPLNIFELVPTYQARFTYDPAYVGGVKEVFSRTTFLQLSSGDENWRVIEKQYQSDSTLPSLSSELNENTRYYWTFQYEDIKKDSWVLGLDAWPRFYVRSILEPWTWEGHPTYTGEADGILAVDYVFVDEVGSIWGNLSEREPALYSPVPAFTAWADADIPNNINTKEVDLENRYSTIVIRIIFRPVFTAFSDTQAFAGSSLALLANGNSGDGIFFNSGSPGIVLLRGGGGGAKYKETLFSFQMGKKYKLVTELTPDKVACKIYDDTGLIFEDELIASKNLMSLLTPMLPQFSNNVDIEEIMIDGIV